MISEPYDPEQAEKNLRRRLIIIGGLVMAPLFLWFTVMEYLLGRMDMFSVTSIGSFVCLANVVVARHAGLNRPLLRWSIAYMFGAALYYVSIDYSASSLMFCLALPFASSFLLGYKEAAIWNTALGLCCMYMINQAAALGLQSIEPYSIDFLASYLFIVVVATGYERMRTIAQERALEENRRLHFEIENKNEIAEKNDRLFKDLSNALKEVRELSGLIPICASCKKVRGDGGDEGFWEHVEAYLHKRTQLTFSHSICPSCTDDAMEALDETELLQTNRQ